MTRILSDNNSPTIPEQIGKIPEKSQKIPKRTKKEGQVQIGKPPRLAADSPESLEFPIRANHPICTNRANRFARITPLIGGAEMTKTFSDNNSLILTAP